MGHTHYFETAADMYPGLWRKFLTVAKQVLEAAEPEIGVPIAGPDGAPGTQPLYTEDCLVFNGAGGQSCESAIFYRRRSPFYFTKTNRYPYEAVVIAIARLAKAVFPDSFGWHWDPRLSSQHRAAAKKLLQAVTGLERIDAEGLRSYVLEAEMMDVSTGEDPVDGSALEESSDEEQYPAMMQVNQAIEEMRPLQEFLQWLERQGLAICRMLDDDKGTYVRDRRSHQELLADYFELDLAAAEQDLRRYLENTFAVPRE